MANFYWSATKINVANYCTMRYYLRYVHPNRPQPLRLSAYVKGSLLHSTIENFWKRLGTPEEVAIKSFKFKEKKYHDSESFIKYVQGKWMGIIISDESSKKIHWKDQNEKWVIKNDLRNICEPLFPLLIEEGPPIFAELPFDFILETNRRERFKGFIDEVRVRNNLIVVRDFKSGYPWIGQMKLKHDPQLTIYNAGLSSLIKSNPLVRERLNLEGKVEEFMGGNRYISPNMQEEFYMIEALKKEKNPIFITNRDEHNFYEVLEMISGVRKSIDTGNVYPERGKKCDLCDLKDFCDGESKKVNSGEIIQKHGQILMDFAKPSYFNQKPSGEIKKKNKILGQTRFNFRYNKETITSENN